MPDARWIRIVVLLAAGLMFLLSVATGSSIDENGLRWLGAVTSGVTLLLFAFDRWIWRWPGIRTLVELGGARVLHGTWRGVLEYQADGEGQPGSQPIYMAIHQTYSKLKVCCYFPTKRSESWSLAASLDPDQHRHVLRYIYQQQAEAPDRATNRPTQGACELVVVGRPVEEIGGSYYAERGGKGRIRFDGYSRKLAGSGLNAERLSYRNLPGATVDEARR
jgi:hypothetical protein